MTPAGRPDLRIGVLHGPASAEDGAYHRATPPDRVSTLDLVAGLREAGWTDVSTVDVTIDADWPSRVTGFDVVVVNLHGTPGEDGAIQGVLDTAGVAYVGSGVEASVLALNKHAAKLVAAHAGIPTPAWCLVDAGRLVGALPAGSEHLLKPVRGGSSIGIREVGPGDPLPADGTWLLEQRRHGLDVTVTVLEIDGRARAMSAVVLGHGRPWLDEQVKLEPELVGRAEVSQPPELAAVLSRCEELAARAHRALGCRDLSRSDFVVAAGGAWFLELNTLPGISRGSYAAASAAAAGYGYPRFLAAVLESALARGMVHREEFCH